MTKKEFMKNLKDCLIGMNQTDKREVLLDYEEHFIDGLSQGRTEEEICESLGDASVIAKDLKSQTHLDKPSNDGVNTAGYIIGIILLSLACLGIGSILIGFITGAISGLFGIVAISAVISNVMIKITAISAVTFAVTLLTLMAMGLIKLLPLIIKWFKQMIYSLDGDFVKAKKVEYKKIKIHAVVWILVSLLCIASLCGVIYGSVAFARETVDAVDTDDIYELIDYIRDAATDFDGYVYYSGNGLDDFEDALDEFEANFEGKFHDNNSSIFWKIIFDKD